MQPKLTRSALRAFAACAVLNASAAHAGFADEVALLLAGEAAQVEVAGKRLWSTPLLRELMADPDGIPRWTGSHVARLREAITLAADDGLTPTDFLATELAEFDRLPRAEGWLLATEALARLAFALRFGKANPQTLEPDWNYSAQFTATDPAQWLREAIPSDDVIAHLHALRPAGPYYTALSAALRAYRALEDGGGWQAVPAGDTIKPGMQDSRVPYLRTRLVASGDVPAGVVPPAADSFDAPLVAAVESFQRRHGLDVDGAVGRQTLAALNVTVAARIDQLRVNLERVRWVFHDLDDEYVAVNIAGFYAVYVDRGRIRWQARAIVGKPYRQTPIFRDELAYLELNPSWTVPPTILRQDILPKLRLNPGYLAERQLRVVDRNGGPVDAATLDWTTVSATRFPYYLRQNPGPDNALGRIKFMFPNTHAVYLHDTPARELFERPERVFSSGCIRIDDPLALAEQLLRDPSRWNRSTLETAIASGATQRVLLPRKVSILLLYLTAFPDAQGDIQFRRDIYGRDAAVLAALNGPLAWTSSKDFPQPLDRIRRIPQ